MLTVVVIMVMGIVLGYLIRNKSRAIALNGKFTMWAIYLLLFLLGVAIGTNEVIVKNLPTLGLQALLISISCILGSVLVAWAGYTLWFKPKRNRDEK